MTRLTRIRTIFFKKLFGLEENFFLSNESTLNDFVELDDIPGHSLKRLTGIPKSERQLYIKDEHLVNGVGRHLVWYPKLTEEEWERFHRATRDKLLDMIEKFTCISMADYPEGGGLYVWKVARHIRRKRHLS